MEWLEAPAHVCRTPKVIATSQKKDRRDINGRAFLVEVDILFHYFKNSS
jgi:hypothetical protein